MIALALVPCGDGGGGIVEMICVLRFAFVVAVPRRSMFQ